MKRPLKNSKFFKGLCFLMSCLLKSGGYAAFSIFTAQTLYSGILAMGSQAELVSILAGLSAK
jgi:hypothetical protein